MGMHNLETKCPICNGEKIVNNENSSIDAYEFYCKDCTERYYLVLASSELSKFKAVVFNYKDKLLNTFKEDKYNPTNKYNPFDGHSPLSFKDIMLIINEK